MPIYCFADLILSSTFTFADLLEPASERKKQSPDIIFHLLDSAPPEPDDTDWIHHWYTPSGDITISLARIGKDFLLRFPALADFVIDGNGCEIGAWPLSDTDEETLRHLLLDQVLPRVLAHKGRLVLHASAVWVGGRAIAFVGETGQGKSTLAASLHLSGYPLLTDDAVLVKFEVDYLKILPCYRGLRLSPQAINILYKELPSYVAMASYSEKNRIKLQKNYDATPVELAALFIINDSDLDEVNSSVKISPLSQRDACMEIVRNAFQLDLSNHYQVKDLFAAASEVAERLPVYSISYPRDFSRLPAVQKEILQHHYGLASEDINNSRYS
jgi:hypothetical protein